MKNKFFDEIKGNFGFGYMRLPMNGEEVDHEQCCKMVDAFLAAGFNYFDTAHVYVNGKSELSLKECLTKRYPRESYILTDKLTHVCFETEEEIRPLFEKQLAACGVEYFDFYLMHAQCAKHFEKYKKCRAYETAFELKKEGKVKHVGISFHDRATMLDQILTEYPQIEVVQLQFNYVDYNDLAVESRKCYDVCVKHNKPVIVMEPVKGGSLVNLPEKAQKIFDELKGGSNASYAIRFAAGHDQVMMVLSGMSTIGQMEDNLSYMTDFQPLNEKELEAVKEVSMIFRQQDLIPCTACKYCVDGCPKNISIPELFADMNERKVYNNGNSEFYYDVHIKDRGKASDCIKCGKCEKICPQHLKIRELLESVAKAFEPAK